MSVAYPSPGRALTLADYTKTPVEPVWLSMRTPDPEIPDQSYSMWESLDQFQQFRLRINYDSAPSGDTVIQIASDPSFSDVVTLDTIPTSADTVAFWSSAENVAYNGMLRIFNDSGETITGVFINGQVASVG